MAVPAEMPVPEGAPAVPADPHAFRTALGRFATGVTVVTTRQRGLDHAMTANAFSAVSIDPLQVLVCVGQEARFHDAVLEAGWWGVSVLDRSARLAATWFATNGRPLHGQLDRYPHHRGPVTGAALLDASLATLECRTTAVHDGGDHAIVVGEVLAVDVRQPDGEPLLWYAGEYRALS